ncbi:hypothetical protein ACIQAC_39480 [Streptomyces sp. NPDC088387]|uniref:hypothetical protein n=1 Tax=Streptomyces sp. NPDC088387 TaxID=3365859 RepID=UPI00380F3F68
MASALFVLVLAWNVTACAAQGAAIVLHVRARRRGEEPDTWNPFGRRLPLSAVGAAAGLAVAVTATGRFALGVDAVALLWPALAGVAVAEVAAQRLPTGPRWAGPAFAAVGAVLLGTVPWNDE